MGNPSGVLAVFAAVARPGLVVPHAQVEDIASIDWEALREAGVRHIVIDKDNCVTLPLQDDVHPDLVPAWQRLSQAGFDSVLVVSNSAGSSDDPLAIGAEHLARTLKQRVLAHPDKKPANACARQILDVVDEDQRNIASTSAAVEAKPAHIAVVGDRITTDIILANRMQRIARQRQAGGLVPMLLQRLRAKQASQSSSSPKAARSIVGILTTRVLERERVGTRLLRTLEMWTLGRLLALGIVPGGSWLSGRRRDGQASDRLDWQGIATRGAVVPKADSQSSLTAEFDDAAAAAEAASQEARSQLPIAMRVRMLPSLALQRIGGASVQAGMWLGQGWCLVQDGIRLGTKGRIGSPDANRMRQSRLLGSAGTEADLSAMHLRDGWPSTSRMFARDGRLGSTTTAQSQPARLAASAPSGLQRRSFATSSRLMASHATRYGSGPHRPPPGWRPNYAAAVAAFILMPTGWYVGTLLHDYLNPPPSAEALAQEAHRLQQQAHPAAGVELSKETQQLSKRGSRSAAESLSDMFTGKPSVQSLYTRRVSVERELERTEQKLAEVRARMAARDQQTGPVTTDSEVQQPVREPLARSRII